MSGSRAASRAWRGLVKETLVIDGTTTVEAVPVAFGPDDGHVVTTHGDEQVLSKAWTH